MEKDIISTEIEAVDIVCRVVDCIRRFKTVLQYVRVIRLKLSSFVYCGINS